MTSLRCFVLGLVLGALIILLLFFAASKAHAQFAMCGDRAEIVGQLAQRYHEERRAGGLLSDRGVAELFVSAKGTWTMLVTLANGKGCIIAAGQDWEDDPPPKPGRPL